MKLLTAKLPQAALQGDAVQEARAKGGTKGQFLQAAWQGDTFQDLVELVTKGQSLQAAWQGDTCQALVEIAAKGQSLQAAWQGDTFQALVENAPKVKVCRLLGKVTPSKLWSK